MEDNICQYRMDFEEFDIDPPQSGEVSIWLSIYLIFYDLLYFSKIKKKNICTFILILILIWNDVFSIMINIFFWLFTPAVFIFIDPFSIKYIVNKIVLVHILFQRVPIFLIFKMFDPWIQKLWLKKIFLLTIFSNNFLLSISPELNLFLTITFEALDQTFWKSGI